jgi:hypothetical protein
MFIRGFPSVQQTACKTIKFINHGRTLSIIDEFKGKIDAIIQLFIIHNTISKAHDLKISC